MPACCQWLPVGMQAKQGAQHVIICSKCVLKLTQGEECAGQADCRQMRLGLEAGAAGGRLLLLGIGPGASGERGPHFLPCVGLRWA